MERFDQLEGLVAPLDAINVDTDQIIPKQFLKRTERSGYGEFLFFDWRYLDDGKTENPGFVLNLPHYRGAVVLLARANFGCGSSREHAPWALHDYGIRCIIAPSFADIFYANCFNNGMLPIVLSPATVDRLFHEVKEGKGYRLRVDLASQSLGTTGGEEIHFEIDPFLKERLLNGWDQIDLTLRHEDEITAYERRRGVAPVSP